MAGQSYYDAQINIVLNADWAVSFAYATLQSDGVTTIPIDLTGSVLRMEIRVQETDHEALVMVNSPDNGISFLNGDPKTGQFTIVITRDKLRYLFPGDFVSDLVRLMPNSYQERLIDATVTVAEGTTR
jgi:hypothetical protein